MHSAVKKRLIRLTISVSLVALGVAFILLSMRDNIMFYYTPSEIPQAAVLRDVFRVGGVVAKNSVYKYTGSKVRFTITDGREHLVVEYTGIIPALFKEGQGAIATGSLQGNVFMATELLAKHDENYKPPKIIQQDIQ